MLARNVVSTATLVILAGMATQAFAQADWAYWDKGDGKWDDAANWVVPMLGGAPPAAPGMIGGLPAPQIVLNKGGKAYTVQADNLVIPLTQGILIDSGSATLELRATLVGAPITVAAGGLKIDSSSAAEGVNVSAKTFAFARRGSAIGKFLNIGGTFIVQKDGADNAKLQVEGSIANAGTLDINAGSSLIQTGAGLKYETTFKQSKGEFKTANAFTGNKISFEFTGGKIVGDVALLDSQLVLGTTASARFIMSGEKGQLKSVSTGAADTAAVRKDQAIIVRADTAKAQVKYVGADAFVNEGTITMDSIVKQGQTAADTVFFSDATASTKIINKGSMNLNKGFGGNRTVGGQVLNDGTITLDAGAKAAFTSLLGNNLFHENHKGAKILLGGGDATLLLGFPDGSAPYSQLKNDGLIKGNGKIAAKKVLNAGAVVGPDKLEGKIDIGNSIGKINIDGDFESTGVFAQAESQLVIEMDFANPNTLIDLLEVSGYSIINGGAVELSFLSTQYADLAVGQRFAFLTSAGGLSGSGFSSLNGQSPLSTVVLDGITVALDFDQSTNAAYIQVISVPGPGTLGVLGLMGLAASRRSRR
jgi:hypothetical protein